MSYFEVIENSNYKQWHVVTDTSQQDELGRGPINVAISEYEDEVTDAIAWMQEGTIHDAKLMSKAREMHGLLLDAVDEINELQKALDDALGVEPRSNMLAMYIEGLTGAL